MIIVGIASDKKEAQEIKLIAEIFIIGNRARILAKEIKKTKENNDITKRCHSQINSSIKK